MARGSEDIYGAMGSVPKAPNEPVKVEGTGAGPMNLHANAEEFGGAVAKGVENVGNAAEDLAVKYGNMVNETQATNAEVSLATKIGQINADYHTKTGQAAYDAYPAYQAAVQQAYAENRQNMTLGAQQAYDMTSRRLVANHVADGASYAASQLKEGHRDAQSSLQDVHIKQILDPDVATNPERVGYNIGTLIHAEQSKLDLDHPGLRVDPETGTVNFDESKPEGQQLKRQYQQNVDSLISQAKTAQFTTLAKPNVMGVLPAYDLYQKERASLPPQAQVALDSSFAPKVFNAHKDNVTSATLADAAAAHSEMLYNPRTTDIAEAIHQQESGGKPHDYQIQSGTFAQYAKPGESPNNPTDQDAVYGRIMADLKKTYPNDSARQAVAYFSGKGNVSPAGSSLPYIEDKADKNGKSVSSYVADVSNRLGGTQTVTQTENAGYNTTQPKYGTNTNGAQLSIADYYRQHSADVYAKGDAYAEQTMPGDLAFKRAVRQTLQNSMSTAISNEKQSQIADNHNVMKAISGEFTKGKSPTTEAELRAIPGVSDLIDKVSAQDPVFAKSIPTLIAKATHANTDTNSPNAYDAIRTALDRSETSSRQGRIEYLSKGLGSDNPGFSISQKDFNDTKPAVDLPDGVAKIVDKHVAYIANLNGNIDGKGQDRAVQWYNEVMGEYKANAAKGDKKLSDPEFIKHINDELTPPSTSTMQQIENRAGSIFKNKDQVPTFSDPNDPAFAKLPSGSQFMVPGETVPRTKK